MGDNKAGMFISPPSGSFTSWENTMCNPLGDMRTQTQSAWLDGYASAKVEHEWQGLTDEEWRRVMEAEEIKGGIPVKFARAIEAKLKEKNT